MKRNKGGSDIIAMLDGMECASEKGSIGKMTGIQKFMVACLVIGLFHIGLSVSAFSADSGTGGALHPREYLNSLLMGVGFLVLGFLPVVVRKLRDKRGKRGKGQR